MVLPVPVPGSKMDEAAAELIKHAGGLVVDGSASFVSNVFNGLIGDRIREWRTANMVRGAAKTAKVLAGLGIDLKEAKALPTLEFYEIFEGMSQQDDDDVASMWANLLASRMTPGLDEAFDRQIPAILQTMNGVEARILAFLDYQYSTRQAAFDETRPTKNLSQDEVQLAGNVQTQRLQKAIDDVEAKYQELFSNSSLDELMRFTSILSEKGLITHVKPINYWDLTERQYLDGIGRSIETLDTEKVAKALARIVEDVWPMDLDRKNSAQLWPAQSYPYSVDYRLTAVGKRLINKCMPPKGDRA